VGVFFDKLVFCWSLLYKFTKAYAFISEDEQIPPIPTKEQPKNNWDDEDADDDAVKESWEDEDEPTPV
jgi:hypothetical protein